MSEQPKPAALYLLAALLFLESAAVFVATIYLVVEIFAAKSASVPSAIALAVTCGIAGVLLLAVAWFTLQARPWIRGAAVAWQVIQVLVAFNILQSGVPSVAWALLVPAGLILILVFTKSVMIATARNRES